MEQIERRNIILENYTNPQNKGLIDDKTYEFADASNESCIDEVHLMAKIENNIIKDIRFDGESCAICTSSASIMIKLLLGKTVDEANNILDNINKMIDEEEYDKDLLKEANVFDDIFKQPSRKKCVLLPWNGIEKILEDKND